MPQTIQQTNYWFVGLFGFRGTSLFSEELIMSKPKEIILTPQILRIFHKYYPYGEDCVPQEDKCILWRGYIGKDGYGRINYTNETKKQRSILAHRVSWMNYYHKTTKGLILHQCSKFPSIEFDNPLCINPLHLYDGTQGENIRDAIENKTHRNCNQEEENNPNYKGYPGQTEEIFRLRNQGLTLQEIGDIVGLSTSHICNILNGKYRI